MNTSVDENGFVRPEPTDERYASWFREVVGMGWVCGLYAPQEILFNYLHNFRSLGLYTDPFPHDHIHRFIIEVTMDENMLTDRPSIEDAVRYFNGFYEDGRVDFGEYIKPEVKDELP